MESELNIYFRLNIRMGNQSLGVDRNIDQMLTERDFYLFMKSAKRNDLETIVYYLSRGIDINLRDCFLRTALMHAVDVGAMQTTNYLLSSGADIDAVDENGETVETIARKRGCLELLRTIDLIRKQSEEKQLINSIESLHLGKCDLFYIKHCIDSGQPK